MTHGIACPICGAYIYTDESRFYHEKNCSNCLTIFSVIIHSRICKECGELYNDGDENFCFECLAKVRDYIPKLEGL